MRPLLALLLALLVFGVVQAFMLFQASLPQLASPQLPLQVRAQGRFSIELTLTFDAQADDFELEPTSLLVQQAGRDLLRCQDPLPAGQPVVIDDVPSISEGSNEIYIKVWTGQEQISVARAVRVRVLRDEQPVAEKTLWSQPGEPVEGVVQLEVSPRRGGVDEQHVH